jgi:hypothetical protein
VAHTCNPSYLGGWNQEDLYLRPFQANSLWDPHLEITRAKWLEVWFSSRMPFRQPLKLKFKPQSHTQREVNNASISYVSIDRWISKWNIFFFFFFLWYWCLNSGFHIKQALYHFSNTSSPRKMQNRAHC